MKITDIEAFHLRGAVEALPDSSMEALLVKVSTDTGLVGWGEASPYAPIWTRSRSTRSTRSSAACRFKDGLVTLPQTSGLGLDVDTDFLKTLKPA